MIPGVPYDAEIEYLESTGTQWIDTGVKPSANIGAICDFLITDARFNDGCILFFGNDNRRWGFSYYNYGRTFQVSDIAYAGYNVFWRNYAVENERAEVSYNWMYDRACSWNERMLENNIRTGSLSYSGPGAIYFFGSFNPSTNAIWRPARMRAYMCKMSLNQQVIRDFIPVRVGQTGYMYDRVTKRLFGNKGTGSFVLGPDVAKPVMGLWGFKSLTAKDYISNGLVAMWDGIENAGWGRHTENPELFKELVGGQPALVGGQFGSNLTTDPNYEITENGLKSNTVGGNYAIGVGIPFTANLGNNWTIEWCRYAHSIPRLQASVNTIMVYPYVDHNGRIWEYVYADGSTFRQKYSGEWNTKVIESSGSGSTFAITCNPTTKRICYKNGVVGSTNGNSFSFYYSANTTHIGFGTNKIGSTLHAFRIYNRALSASEISFNHKIDKERFRL